MHDEHLRQLAAEHGLSARRILAARGCAALHVSLASTSYTPAKVLGFPDNAHNQASKMQPTSKLPLSQRLLKRIVGTTE